MINRNKRTAGLVWASRSVFVGIVASLMIGLVAVDGSAIVWTLQTQIMEYYIYYKGDWARHSGRERHEQAFKTWNEAEEARQKAAVDTQGLDESVLRDTYIKEVPTGRYTTPPVANPSPAGSPPVKRPPAGSTTTTPRTTTSQNNFESDNAKLIDKLNETIATASFDGDKADLLGALNAAVSAGDDEIATVKAELSKMTPATLAEEKMLIAQQQTKPDPVLNSYVRTLKIKAPPLPVQRFANLIPGDVLLSSPEVAISVAAWTGGYIRLFDKLTSWEFQSLASHSFIYLREVKGVKLFLDNLPGEGPRIKTENEIKDEYWNCHIDVARPVSRPDADKLWAAAREEGVKQLNAEVKALAGTPDFLRWLNTGTNYGIVGDDNMVCSETCRWVLTRALSPDDKIADTESPFKKLVGIYFGPVNFYSDVQNFMIFPLEKLPPKR
jgi:hypothetical protein